MTYFLIAQQRATGIEAIQVSKGLNPAIVSQTMARIFPAGDDWSEFTGARSFKLINLDETHTLLSYTLVLGRDEGFRNGSLRAWGAIDTPQATYDTLRSTSQSPRRYFQKIALQFDKDNLYEAMRAGLLKDAAKSVRVPRWPCWSQLGLQLGLKTAFTANFQSASQWAVIEDLVAHAFNSVMWKTKLRSQLLKKVRLTAFTTLTLSTGEPAQIVGLCE